MFLIWITNEVMFAVFLLSIALAGLPKTMKNATTRNSGGWRQNDVAHRVVAVGSVVCKGRPLKLQLLVWKVSLEWFGRTTCLRCFSRVFP